ncbi:MAG: hypothetical protein KIT22_09625 [Verrucomicrobiae bacterium]|nr:hypothetical protein [Verrucomicrobiae bacterium]
MTKVSWISQPPISRFPRHRIAPDTTMARTAAEYTLASATVFGLLCAMFL